jgi:hypothetical protein
MSSRASRRTRPSSESSSTTPGRVVITLRSKQIVLLSKKNSHTHTRSMSAYPGLRLLLLSRAHAAPVAASEHPSIWHVVLSCLFSILLFAAACCEPASIRVVVWLGPSERATVAIHLPCPTLPPFEQLRRSSSRTPPLELVQRFRLAFAASSLSARSEIKCNRQFTVFSAAPPQRVPGCLPLLLLVAPAADSVRANADAAGANAKIAPQTQVDRAQVKTAAGGGAIIAQSNSTRSTAAAAAAAAAAQQQL